MHISVPLSFPCVVRVSSMNCSCAPSLSQIWLLSAESWLEPKHEYPRIYTENELGIECGLAEIEVTLGGGWWFYSTLYSLSFHSVVVEKHAKCCLSFFLSVGMHFNTFSVFFGPNCIRRHVNNSLYYYNQAKSAASFGYPPPWCALVD